MSKVFYRKKFSDYLGEQRAIDDIVQFYQPDGGVTPTPTPVPVTPTPTPSITPTNTLTPTPSITPTNTNTPTTTTTPTVTPTNTNTPSVTPTITPTKTTTPTPTLTNTPTPTSSPAPLIDPDALAYMNKVISVGGTLTPTMSAATITLVDNLKSAGIWNTLDIFLPVLGGTANSHKINLVEPNNINYDWTYYGTVIHDVSGMTTNGAAGAVVPTWNMNQLVYSTSGSSFYTLYRNRSSAFWGVNGFINTETGVPYTWTCLGNLGTDGYNGLYGQNNASGFGSFPTTRTGSLAIHRSAPALQTLYYNNSVNATQTTAITKVAGPLSAKPAILALYWYPNYAPNYIYNEFGDDRVCTWAIGGGLNTTERTDMYSSIVSFNTTLGRNA